MTHGPLWLRGYRRAWLLPDVLAGLIVWSVVVPQAVAASFCFEPRVASIRSCACRETGAVGCSSQAPARRG